MGIQIDQQDASTAECEGRAEIGGGGRLADSALLIGNGDDSRHVALLALSRWGRHPNTAFPWASRTSRVVCRKRARRVGGSLRAPLRRVTAAAARPVDPLAPACVAKGWPPPAKGWLPPETGWRSACERLAPLGRTLSA